MRKDGADCQRADAGAECGQTACRILRRKGIPAPSDLRNSERRRARSVMHFARQPQKATALVESPLAEGEETVIQRSPRKPAGRSELKLRTSI